MSRVRIDRGFAGWMVAGLLAASLSGVGATSARAQAAALSWHCWVDGGERLSCVLDAGSEAQAPSVPAPAPQGGVSSAALGAAARRLPPIVAQLREQPRTLAGQVIVIPMYSITDDWPRVTQLARAVLCSSPAPCSVRLSTSLNEALSRGLDTDRLFIGPDLGLVGQAAFR